MIFPTLLPCFSVFTYTLSQELLHNIKMKFVVIKMIGMLLCTCVIGVLGAGFKQLEVLRTSSKI